MKVVRWVLLLPVSLVMALGALWVVLLVFNLFERLPDWSGGGNPLGVYFGAIISGVGCSCFCAFTAYHLAPAYKDAAVKWVQAVLAFFAAVGCAGAYIYAEWVPFVNGVAVFATTVYMLAVGKSVE